MTQILRVGIIGAGRIVERIHIPILKTLPSVKIVSIFDIDYNRAQSIALKNNIPGVFRSVEGLLECNPDVVLVACPNVFHADMSIKALNAKAHVICEKPMATTFADAQAMVQAAKNNNRNLFIAFTNRYRPDVITLTDIINSGALGEIKDIYCGWLRHNGIPGINTWFTKQNLSGGGALIDLGSHLIDIAISLSQKQQLLSAYSVLEKAGDMPIQSSWYETQQNNTTGQFDVEVSASGFAHFEDSFNLFVNVSWDCNVQNDQTFFSVTGTKGSAQLRTLFGLSPNGFRPEQPLTICIDGKSDLYPIQPMPSILYPYEKQWVDFVDCLQQNHCSYSKLQDSLTSLHVIEEMYHHAYQSTK